MPVVIVVARDASGDSRRLDCATLLLRWRRLDDHPARPVGEHRLELLAEQRAAAAVAGERHDDRAGAHLARLVDDDAARAAGPDLLPVSRDAPAALELGLLDERL